jgi:hypothetical protein
MAKDRLIAARRLVAAVSIHVGPDGDGRTLRPGQDSRPITLAGLNWSPALFPHAGEPAPARRPWGELANCPNTSACSRPSN